MTPHLTLNRRHFIAGSALLFTPFRTSAQGTPVSSSPHALSAALMLDQLPGKRVNAHFAHLAFAPGAAAPLAERVGSALMLVESGTLMLTSDGQAAIRRAGVSGSVSPADV